MTSVSVMPDMDTGDLKKQWTSENKLILQNKLLINNCLWNIYAK